MLKRYRKLFPHVFWCCGFAPNMTMSFPFETHGDDWGFPPPDRRLSTTMDFFREARRWDWPRRPSWCHAGSSGNQCFSLQYLGCSCKFPLKKRWLNLIYGYWNGGKIWKYRENHEQLVDDEGLQGSPGQGEKIHLQFLIVSDCVYLNCSSKISPICKPHWMVNYILLYNIIYIIYIYIMIYAP